MGGYSECSFNQISFVFFVDSFACMPPGINTAGMVDE